MGCGGSKGSYAASSKPAEAPKAEEAPTAPRPRRDTMFDALLLAEMKPVKDTIFSDSKSADGVPRLGSREDLDRQRSVCLREKAAFQSQLLSLWDKFDEDKSGHLNLEETRELTREYLDACKLWVPQLVSARIESTVEMACTGLRDPDVVRGVMLRQVGGMRGRLEAITTDLLDGVDVDDTARKLFEEMDTDRDGQVTRDEFTAKFAPAISKMIISDKVDVSIAKALGIPPKEEAAATRPAEAV